MKPEMFNPTTPPAARRHAGFETLEPRVLYSTTSLVNGPYTEYVSSVGEPNSAFYAQTFEAPSGLADSLTLDMYGYNTTGDNFVRILITETDAGSSDFAPTNILFESDTQVLPSDGSFFSLTVDLGGIDLVDGNTYAFMIDALSDADGLPNQAAVGVANGYDDGSFYYINYQGAGTDRQDHFDGSWQTVSSYEDLAFTLTFLPENTAPTLAVTNPNATDGDAEQYSDSIDAITFDATDADGDALTASIEYSTDGGATFAAGLPDAGTLGGGLSFAGSESGGSGLWTLDGVADLAPGDYTFRVTVDDGNGGETSATAELSIEAEDAAATYTGVTLISSANTAAGEFSVDLRTTIQDATKLGLDAEGGDITAADVTFRVTDTAGNIVAELPATLSTFDSLSAAASANFAGQLGAGVDASVYTVEVLVEGSYQAMETVVLSIARPGDGFTLGAGYIIEDNAYGGSVSVSSNGQTQTVSLDVADDTRISVGYHARFKRSGELRGDFAATFQDTNGDYWAITTSDLTSLSTQGNEGTFLADASLINLSTGQLATNLTLIVSVTESENRREPDTIGFSLWDGSSLVFSSNWDGTTTLEQELDRGQIKVKD